MKQLLRTNLLILGSTVFYLFLFWQEEWGLNTLIFSLFIVALLYWYRSELVTSRLFAGISAALLLSATFVLFNNSMLSKVVHNLFFILFIGYAQRRELRFFLSALGLGLLGPIIFPFSMGRRMMGELKSQDGTNDLLKWLGLVILPLGILSLFFFIYYAANSHFAELVDTITSYLWIPAPEGWTLTFFIQFLLGFLSIGGLLWKISPNSFLNLIPSRLSWMLVKSSFHFQDEEAKAKTHFIISEYQIGILSIGMLNGLLLIVNFIDIQHVWFSQEILSAHQLSQYVHEGTYLLIFAILLAMALVLFFFRGSLNFFANNFWLKGLVYGWLIQNAILAVSVGMRNYHYIAQYGLAYNRIGVVLFLLVVLAGLASLFIKIKDRKNLAFLLHINGWSLFLCLLLASSINWDIWITRYNLRNIPNGGLDYYYLLYDLSDKNLRILLDNKQLIQNQMNKESEEHSLEYGLEKKYLSLKRRQVETSWKSWNRPDARNWNYINRYNSFE